MIATSLRYDREGAGGQSARGGRARRTNRFAMELKILRTVAQLTQKQLADLVGLDDSTISLIEAGKRDLGNVAYASVVRIGRALAPGFPIEQVFPVADWTPTPEDVERHV
jgi:transcriptional regulator with XRE-family HTH domain